MTRRTERVLIGLGGNLGNPAAAMREALRLIESNSECAVTQVSSFWRTPPWGKTDQPDFINACAAVETSLDPRVFLGLCLGIEQTLHRVRSERWGPRSIDIDILFFGDRIIQEDGLTVPHPRIAERAFVLVPLAEIVPEILLGEMTVGALAKAADMRGILRLE